MTNTDALARIAARSRLNDSIANRTATVAVVGQGYVGLPLALASAQAGFNTVGLDVDPQTVRALNDGRSHIGDVSAATVQELRTRGAYSATTNNADLSDADVVVICVPTPLRHGAPDITFIERAATALSEHLKHECLVILESTTYPGTTEEVVLPLLISDKRTIEADSSLRFRPSGLIRETRSSISAIRPRSSAAWTRQADR